MKQEIETSERIESYLKGTLPENEKQQFEKQMSEDASFAHQVELYGQLHRVITDGAYMNIKNELGNIHSKKSHTTRTIRRITGFGSAGLILGLVLFLVVVKYNKTGAPGEETPVNVFEKPIAAKRSGELPVSDTSVMATEVPNASIDRVITTDASDTGVSENTIAVQRPGAVEIEAAVADSAHEIQTELSDQIVPDLEPEMPEISNEIIPATKESSTIDCNEITIEASFTGNVSCNNEPTGSIVIDRQSVTGGTPPYAFSLNRKSFTDTTVISALYPGSYSLFARDMNGCTSLLGTAYIGSEDCTYQAVFAPLRGETWTVPVDEDRSGILFIYSKEGNMVYTIPVNGTETVVWSGETLSGQALPMGLYQFEIRYDDGYRFFGNVTIVR